EQDFSKLERGRYLTTLADCAACHRDPIQGRDFAGGRPIETPFGNVLAPNITPDRVTGIGNWSDAEFDTAVRRGKRPDGKLLYPAMPFPYYARMS
ncbi:MAG: cytochrome c, partial [Hyphomicrobiales bacterium]|nr:cytochrome c [Hyphomicrobiales bacterium]